MAGNFIACLEAGRNVLLVEIAASKALVALNPDLGIVEKTLIARKS